MPDGSYRAYLRIRDADGELESMAYYSTREKAQASLDYEVSAYCEMEGLPIPETVAARLTV